MLECWLKLSRWKDCVRKYTDLILHRYVLSNMCDICVLRHTQCNAFLFYMPDTYVSGLEEFEKCQPNDQVFIM